MRLLRLSLTALATALPATLTAQGQLIARTACAPMPRPCPPNADCIAPAPEVQQPCGPFLLRTSSAVKVGLANRVLRYEVTETFVNRGARVAEADYIFPLPQGAAFEDLKLSINGELVSGETMSAEKARGIYEEIVRRQRDPALVEWMGSGMLRTRIFPINPGEEKKVVVRFQSVAVREGDALRIDYRRGSNPNGTGAPQTRPRVEPTANREESQGWTSFALLYERTNDLGAPYSPTHSLHESDDGKTHMVEARGSGAELTIILPLRRANTAAINVLTHAPSRDEAGFALFTITPPATSRRTVPRDVTLVIDVSGSMRGKKLANAKSASNALLASLRNDDRFRVIDFSTDVRSFRDGWAVATDDNLRAARRYINDLNADGSTNISGALDEALTSRRDTDRLPLVVFMTDGEPTIGERNPDRIADLAARQRGTARVFAIGVSAEVNAALIEQLAIEGRGTAHFVRDDESVESTMSLLASRLSAPVLTNARVQVDGVRLSQVLPNGPIDVFAGQDLVVLARYEGDGAATVRLQGESVDGPVTWSTRVNFADHDRANPFVARLWAAQRLGWLAAEKRKSGGSTEMDNEIRTLGQRYGIPTEFSSYLVVEPGMQLAAQGRRDMSAARGAGSTDQARLREKAAPAPTSPSALQDVVVSGQAQSSNSARFEDARDAAKKREAKSTAELDEAERSSSARRVGDRLFTLANGVWTDTRFTPKHRTVKVKPFSQAYFDVLQRLNTLAPAFALGDQVIVAGRVVAIELSAQGAERLTAAELSGIERDW